MICICEEKCSLQLPAGNSTEHVQFRRIRDVLNCSMWVFSFPYAYTGLFTFPWRRNVYENKIFSETDRRLIKRIRHRVGCGILSSSGHKGAVLKSLPPALHSLLLRARMSWTFCDKQQSVTLDFFISLLDGVSSPAGPFRTRSENFAAQPQTTVSIPSQARIKPSLLLAPLAATNVF
jgi:hypothetical protein